MVLPFPFKGKRINRQYPSIIWQCIEGHPYKILSVPKGTHPASKLSQRFYLRCCKSNHQKKKKKLRPINQTKTKGFQFWKLRSQRILDIVSPPPLNLFHGIVSGCKSVMVMVITVVWRSTRSYHFKLLRIKWNRLGFDTAESKWARTMQNDKEHYDPTF